VLSTNDPDLAATFDHVYHLHSGAIGSA